MAAETSLPGSDKEADAARRTSLTRRVLGASMIGLLAGVLVAAGFGGIVLVRERERAHADLVAAAAGAGESVRGQMARVGQALRVLSAMDDALRNADDCVRRLAAVEAQLAPVVSGLFVVDAAAIIQCAVPPTVIGQSLAESPNLRTLQSEDGPVTSAIVMGRFAPEELVGISVARPRREGGREGGREDGRRGMISAGVRVSALSARSRLARGVTSLWLVDTGGRVIGLQDDPEAVPPPPTVLAQLGTPAAAQTIMAQDVRLLAAADRISPSLGVVATRPLRAVEAEALDLALWALLPALATLAAAIGMMTLLLRGAVLRPLRLMAGSLGDPHPAAGADTAERALPTELGAIWARVAGYQKQVREREDRLTAALEIQSQLTREVHHRTKNNLQIVSSLLALQERRSDDTDVAQQLRTARERVATLATLHRQLYGGQAADRMNLQQFLSDLVGSIAHANDAEARGIRIRLDADPVQLLMDQGAPLGLVVNELVTNSLKYAFGDRSAGTITVTARLTGEQLEVVVADDGIGTAGDDLPSGGLGSSLISAFARQLGGRVERRAVPGTVIALTFPLAADDEAEAPPAPAEAPAGD